MHFITIAYGDISSSRYYRDTALLQSYYGVITALLQRDGVTFSHVLGKIRFITILVWFFDVLGIMINKATQITMITYTHICNPNFIKKLWRDAFQNFRENEF